MITFSWSGYAAHTHTGFIYASDSRVDHEMLFSDLNNVCTELEQSVLFHVRKIASIVGQCISFCQLR